MVEDLVHKRFGKHRLPAARIRRHPKQTVLGLRMPRIIIWMLKDPFARSSSPYGIDVLEALVKTGPQTSVTFLQPVLISFLFFFLLRLARLDLILLDGPREIADASFDRIYEVLDKDWGLAVCQHNVRGRWAWRE